MRGVWGLMWAAGVGVSVICGCASAGPRDVRPAATPTATVTTTGLLIDTIDGNNMRQGFDGARTRFDVAPGRHELGVSRQFFVGSVGRVRSEYAMACIEVVAGHSYLARLSEAAGSWTTAVTDTATGVSLETACTPPAAPVVAASGIADGAGPAPTAPAPADLPTTAITMPVEDSRPDRPGSGVALRAGLGVGGDALISATPSNGDEATLRAGTGLMFAVGGTFTPFWLRKNFGFGVGLELGWKFDSVQNSNGRRSFVRYPLVATAHVLARTARRWYFKLALGIEKPLAPHNWNDGEADVDLPARVGPAGEIGFYRLVRRHGGLDLSLRYSRPRYVVGGQSVDGGSVAFLIGGHYDM